MSITRDRIFQAFPLFNMQHWKVGTGLGMRLVYNTCAEIEALAEKGNEEELRKLLGKRMVFGTAG